MKVALIIAALVPITACTSTEWRGITVDPPQPIPAFSFVAADGNTVSTAPERGRPTLLFFGYTHCPDVCPVTLADWSRARAQLTAQLGADADRVRWLFVSVDPARDTPEIAGAYATQFDTRFIGVSGDSASTANIQRAFSVTSYETPGATDADYLVTHASHVFLLDDTGQLRLMYPFNVGPDALVADLTRLLN